MLEPELIALTTQDSGTSLIGSPRQMTRYRGVGRPAASQACLVVSLAMPKGGGLEPGATDGRVRWSGISWSSPDSANSAGRAGKMTAAGRARPERAVGETSEGKTSWPMERRP